MWLSLGTVEWTQPFAGLGLTEPRGMAGASAFGLCPTWTRRCRLSPPGRRTVLGRGTEPNEAGGQAPSRACVLQEVGLETLQKDNRHLSHGQGRVLPHQLET